MVSVFVEGAVVTVVKTKKGIYSFRCRKLEIINWQFTDMKLKYSNWRLPRQLTVADIPEPYVLFNTRNGFSRFNQDCLQQTALQFLINVLKLWNKFYINQPKHDIMYLNLHHQLGFTWMIKVNMTLCPLPNIL